MTIKNITDPSTPLLPRVDSVKSNSFRERVRSATLNAITSPINKQSKTLHDLLKYNEGSSLLINHTKKRIKFIDNFPAQLAKKVFNLVNGSGFHLGKIPVGLHLGFLFGDIGTVLSFAVAATARIVATVATAAFSIAAPIVIGLSSAAATVAAGAFTFAASTVVVLTSYIWSPILNIYQFMKLKKIQAEINSLEKEIKNSLPRHKPEIPKEYSTIKTGNDAERLSSSEFMDHQTISPFLVKKSSGKSNLIKKIANFNDKKAAQVSESIYFLLNERLFYKFGLNILGPLGKTISLVVASTARLVTFVALSALEVAGASILLGLASNAAGLAVVTIPLWSPLLNKHLSEKINQAMKTKAKLLEDKKNLLMTQKNAPSKADSDHRLSISPASIGTLDEFAKISPEAASLLKDQKAANSVENETDDDDNLFFDAQG